MKKIKRLFPEDFELFLDLVESIVDTTNEKLHTDTLQEIQFGLKREHYRMESLRKVNICLSKSKEAYTNQLDKWKKDFKELGISPDIEDLRKLDH